VTVDAPGVASVCLKVVVAAVDTAAGSLFPDLSEDNPGAEAAAPVFANTPDVLSEARLVGSPFIVMADPAVAG
jgi:hypothetical protein